MSRPNAQFNERPFRMGTITGIRCFKVSTYGRLTGPNKSSAVFKPGENLAECIGGPGLNPPQRKDFWEQLREAQKNEFGRTRTVKFEGFTHAMGDDTRPPRRPPPPEAILGMERLIQHLADRVFQAPDVVKMAADVGIKVALVNDSRTTDPMQLELELREPESEPYVHTVGMDACTCGYYAYLSEEFNRTGGYDRYDAVLGLIEGYGVVTVGPKGFRASKARLACLVGQVVSDGEWALKAVKNLDIQINYSDYPRFVPDSVARNYPEVPVFPTLAVALANFPLTEPDIKES